MSGDGKNNDLGTRQDLGLSVSGLHISLLVNVDDTSHKVVTVRICTPWCFMPGRCHLAPAVKK